MNKNLCAFIVCVCLEDSERLDDNFLNDSQLPLCDTQGKG